MNRILNRLGHVLAGISLKRKILYIVLFSIILVSCAGISGLQLATSAYNRLLQDTLARNLSNSATTVSFYLANIETMSGLMLSDANVQSNLASVKHSENPRIRTEAYRNLAATVLEYYQQYKSNYIGYITLNNEEFITYSNYLGSQKTPDHIESHVLEAAHEGDGRPVWISDYSDEYGLFMGRLFKYIQSSNLEELGTLIVSVDLNGLMDSLNFNEGMYEDAQYYILADDRIIYNHTDLSESVRQGMEQIADGKYAIMTVDGHRYFAVSNTIPGFNWTYACYVSYDPIFHTVSLAKMISIVMLVISVLLSVVFAESMIAFLSRHTNPLVRKMQAFSADENAVIENAYDYSRRRDEFGLLNRQFDSMAEKIRELIQVNYVNELWKKDAQLKALEMQINPHFLYNTLESVNWRAKAAGNGEISCMVESLGTLLRATLSKTNSILDLKQELEIITAYITIQKYRFEDRLEYCITCEEGLYGARIPKMIIQPLVENAINYGLEESTEFCSIGILIEHDRTDHTLVIHVKNDGSQFEEDLLLKLRSSQIKPNGFGIGLINIDERIKLMYGREYGLTLYNEDEKAVAEIRMPYITGEEGDADAETDHCG